MLCENLNVCSESTMTNSYYGQRTNLVDAAALDASSSKIAKWMFQKTYGKLLTV